MDKQRKAFLIRKPLRERRQVVSDLKRFARIAQDVVKGLEGEKQFNWYDVDSGVFTYLSEQMGATLITLRNAEQLGYKLKRGQKPVGHISWPRPLNLSAEYYVLECQFNRPKEEDK